MATYVDLHRATSVDFHLAIDSRHAFVLRGGAVVVDTKTTTQLASLQHAAPLPGTPLRAMIGAGVAQAACDPNRCYVFAAGCGFFGGCCFTGVHHGH